MMKKLPLQKVFTLLESGPIVLLTTACGGKQNIFVVDGEIINYRKLMLSILPKGV